MNKPWYGRPVLAFFVFAAVSLLFIFTSRDIRLGQSTNLRYNVYSIRFEYFGMDASEMERLITIPLEEKIGALSGLFEIRSVSEYGKSVTTVFFDKKNRQKNTYLALRDAVDTLYSTLPTAVQKPRIYSSEAEQRAVLSVMVTGSGDLGTLRKYLDTTVKKELEGVDGVAEVLIAGGVIDEIRVEFSPERIVEGGIDPASFASIIQDANVVSPGGRLYSPTREHSVVFDTKIKTLDEIKKLPVKLGEQIISMEYLAKIAVLPRLKEEIVRIDGKEGVAILVKSAFAGNSIKISRDCKAILAKSGLPQDSYRILYDSGEFAYKLIRTVIIAVLESFLCVMILIPFFFGSIRIIGLLLLLLLTNTLWTIAQLNILGYSPDQNTLSGIAIALGLVVDSALVIAGIAGRTTDLFEFRKTVREILGAIAASAITTLLVLIPLYFLDSIVPGIRAVAVTIGLMIGNSLIISCVFFPCFAFGSPTLQPVVPVRIIKKIERFYARFSYRTTLWSLAHTKTCLILYVVLIIGTFAIFTLAGKNISFETQDAVLFAVIEFEPEKSSAVIDDETAVLIPQLRAEKGVRFVRSESRKGVAEFEIGFDEKKTNRFELANSIRQYEKNIPDGFLYLPESGVKSATRSQELEVTVTGDDARICREIAREAVKRVSHGSSVKQVVLNFKNAEQIFIFTPDRDTLAKNGITVETVASTLRWMVFGPVVDKWIQNDEETDIRIVGEGLQQTVAERITNLYIPTEGGRVRLDTLGSMSMGDGDGKLYRRDGRRAAYFTVHTASKSTDAAIAEVGRLLYEQPIEKGYGFLFARELAQMKKQYAILLLAFLASVTGIVLLLTALSENCIKSLVITSIIPVSVCFPLLATLISGRALEMGDVVGMVIVSGISVNNAIYIAESVKRSVIISLREKIKSILVTSLTSIAGAIPLVIVGKDGFSASLAFFMMWGTAGSLVSSLILFPAVISLIKREKK